MGSTCAAMFDLSTNGIMVGSHTKQVLIQCTT